MRITPYRSPILRLQDIVAWLNGGPLGPAPLNAALQYTPVDPDWLKAALATQQTARDRTADGQLKPPNWSKAVLVSDRIKAALVKKLRSLVDEWIDSAVYPDGSESPKDRSITGPLLKFLPRRKLPKRKPDVVLTDGIPKPEPESLHAVLVDWIARVGGSISIDAAGQYDVRVPDPHPSRVSGNLMTRYPVEEYAQDRAIFYFKQLLELPDAQKVARCANTQCRLYYVRGRLRTRLILRGAFCGKCIGIGSRDRMKISREVKTKKLVEVAANYWDQWPSTSRNGKNESVAHNERVAGAINKELKLNLQERKTGKWVARNQTDIELELERRKNAKS